MIARFHSLLGVIPLTAFVPLHLLRHWPALVSREHWVGGARGGLSPVWELTLVIVPLGLHALLGLVRLREPSLPLAGPASLRRLQALTGIFTAAFILFHLSHVWPAQDGAHHGLYSAYGELWRRLGQPAQLSAYVVGLTCVCFHLGHGLSRATVTWSLVKTPAGLRNARFAFGFFAAILWLMALQLVSQFAVGEGLIPISPAPGSS